MLEKINADIVSAMKEHDTLKLSTLRLLKGAVDLERINKRVDKLNDDDIIAIIAKQIKTRKESISEFEKGNRSDLIEKTNIEIELLSKYLPEQLSHDELMNVIDSVFAKVNPTSGKDMGLIMKELTPLVKGKCDMKEVSLIIKDKLSNL